MAKDKKNKTSNGAGASIPGTTMTSKGYIPTNTPPAHSIGGTAFSYTNQPLTSDKANKKSKKDKKSKTTTINSTGRFTGQPNLSNLSPDQLSQLQLEEAIKESQNPAMKLKKLKSPISLKGFFISLFIIVVFTIALALLYIGIFGVDKFNFIYIVKDILNKSGIGPALTSFFTKLGNWFTGKGFKMIFSI